MSDTTRVLKINIGPTTNLDAEITRVCDMQRAAGRLLSASFLHGAALVLIFQKPL